MADVPIPSRVPEVPCCPAITEVDPFAVLIERICDEVATYNIVPVGFIVIPERVVEPPVNVAKVVTVPVCAAIL